MADIEKIKSFGTNNLPNDTTQPELQTPSSNQQDFGALNTTRNQMREDLMKESSLAMNASQGAQEKSIEKENLGLNSILNVHNSKEEVRALKAQALRAPGGIAKSLIDLAKRKMQEVMDEIKKAKEAFIDSAKLQKLSFTEQDRSRNAQSKAKTSDNNLNLPKQ